jgi:hypothetical protein
LTVTGIGGLIDGIGATDVQGGDPSSRKTCGNDPPDAVS